MATTWNPFEHHRGPYVLQVLRETPTLKVKWHTETLPGRVEPEDIPSEAQALLEDPRDTIVTVLVFSEYEQQHVTSYKRRTV